MLKRDKVTKFPRKIGLVHKRMPSFLFSVKQEGTYDQTISDSLPPPPDTKRKKSSCRYKITVARQAGMHVVVRSRCLLSKAFVILVQAKAKRKITAFGGKWGKGGDAKRQKCSSSNQGTSQFRLVGFLAGEKETVSPS